jgi:CheY-like chemotaxis protein
VPDLVLLDLVMPGVDGLAVAKQVRALELPRQPKVVAVTANAFEEARRRSLAEGCDAFLTKPVDFDELCVTLGALLGLEWQYTDAVEPRPAYSSVPTAVPSVPSAQLAELSDLARAGDVMALESRLDALAAEPKHAAFVAELRELVGRMDLRGIERWLQSLLTEDDVS